MADTVLKRLQLGTEGAFTTGASFGQAGSISVYSAGGAPVTATRRLAVEQSTEFGYQDLTWTAPEEARGSYAAYYTHLLEMRMAKGKFSALLYPDEMIWWCRAAISGVPTVTTLPAVAQGILATPVSITSSTTVTLSGITEPNAQTDAGLAKILQCIYANASSTTTPVTFTFVGTDINGNELTEVVNFSAGTTTPSYTGGGAAALTVTLYTTNYFATITSVTASTTVSGSTITVKGVNGFLWVFSTDLGTSTLVSLTGEFFDGSTGWRLPGLIVPKFDLDLTVGKSVTIKGDCLAKDMVTVSLASIADQVLPAASSYATRYYSDPIGSVPGTTQVSARLISASLSMDNQLETGKAADGTPLPTFIGRKRYKSKADYTLLFNSGASGSEDPSDFGAFSRLYQSRVILLALPSTGYLPCGPLTGATLSASGWPTQLGDSEGTTRGGLYGITVAHAGKFIAGAPVDVSGRLAVKLTQDMEVDLAGMGVPYQIQIVSRVNPNMA